MKTNRQIVTAQERALEAYEMRKDGCTYSQIGERLGITAQGAYKIVSTRLKHINEKLSEEVEDLRTLEVERLDKMLFALDGKVKGGGEKAIEVALKIADRRAKLLGLDAPTKVAPTDPAGNNPYRAMSDDELRALAASVLSKADD